MMLLRWKATLTIQKGAVGTHHHVTIIRIDGSLHLHPPSFFLLHHIADLSQNTPSSSTGFAFTCSTVP
jgi:hypothetical protein